MLYYRFWTFKKAIAGCIVILLIGGVFYRQFSEYLQKAAAQPVSLDVPLKNLPIEINNWQGRDVPIPDEIVRVAQNDDFVNRYYANSQHRISANLYIAFSATPRTMLGHRPDVCYKGAGFNHEFTEEKILKSAAGLEFPCLVHKFSLGDKVIYVLNFYILNGTITTNEGGFAGIAMRLPNIEGKIARYVAQVQISSDFQISTEQAAIDFTDIILEFLPDQNGLTSSNKYLAD